MGHRGRVRGCRGGSGRGRKTLCAHCRATGHCAQVRVAKCRSHATVAEVSSKTYTPCIWTKF
jgi:hypothetical protein